MDTTVDKMLSFIKIISIMVLSMSRLKMRLETLIFLNYLLCFLKD